MLFIESRIADLNVEKSLRTPLLEAMQERGLVPLIRSSRLHFFEQALMSAERVKELEQAVAEWSDAEGDEPYVRGDVFCFDDFAHFIIFGEDGDGGTGLRAGIIYDAATAPARVRRYNREHGVGAAVGIAPVVAPGSTGLALAGQF